MVIRVTKNICAPPCILLCSSEISQENIQDDNIQNGELRPEMYECFSGFVVLWILILNYAVYGDGDGVSA